MSATVSLLKNPSGGRAQAGGTPRGAVQGDLFADAAIDAAAVAKSELDAQRPRPAPRPATVTASGKAAHEGEGAPVELSPQQRAQMWRSDPRAAFSLWKTSGVPGKRNFASQSIAQYLAMFGAFLRWLDESSLEITTVSAAQLESFLNEGIGRPDADGRRAPAATTTRLRYLGLLKSVFEQLRDAGLRQSNPAVTLLEGTDSRNVKPPPRILQADAVARYKEWTLSRPIRTWLDVRNRALRLIFLASGAVQLEVLNLRRRDLALDPETGLFVLQIEGWGMTPPHSVPVAAFATEAIQAWLDELRAVGPDADVLFPRSSQTGEFEMAPITSETCFGIVQEVMEGIGWDEARQGPQTLRNTFIAQQIRAGVPSSVIRHWCGLHTDDTISRVAQLVPIRDAAPLPA